MSEHEERSQKQTLLDLILNGAGFGIAAITGLLLSVLAISGWGASGWGVISQALAIHVVATQLGVTGQQNALVNYISEAPNNLVKVRGAVQASLLVVLLGAAFYALATFFLAPYIAKLLGSSVLEEALRFTSLAIFAGCFPKLIYAILTGRERMRSLAFIQALRPSLILLGALIVLLMKLPVQNVMLAIAMAEIISVLIGASLALPGLEIWKPGGQMISSLKPQLNFGIKSMLAGVIGELNTRVDVLILGLFSSDAIVGIYAFAAMLAEGFYLLMVVSRIVFSPKIVRMLQQEDKAPFIAFFKFWRIRIYGAAILIFAASVAAFPVVVWVLGFEPEMMQAWPLYAILAGGVVMASGYVPVSSSLMLAGFPGRHTLYFMGIVIINIIGNFILTPLYGPFGTAIATSIAYAAGVIMIIILAKSVLKLRLW